MVDKSDILTTKFDGNNYFLWQTHFRNFVEGKELWGYINGSIEMPYISKDKVSNELNKEQNGKQIMVQLSV